MVITGSVPEDNHCAKYNVYNLVCGLVNLRAANQGIPCSLAEAAIVAAIELICYPSLPILCVFRETTGITDREWIWTRQGETSLNPLTRRFYILLRVFSTRVRAAASKLPREKVHPSRTKSARAFIVHPRQLPMRYIPFFIRHRHIHRGNGRN